MVKNIHKLYIYILSYNIIHIIHAHTLTESPINTQTCEICKHTYQATTNDTMCAL